MYQIELGLFLTTVVHSSNSDFPVDPYDVLDSLSNSSEKAVLIFPTSRHM